MYWCKRTVSSYNWSHRGEISHSGSYDIPGAQDEHCKDLDEFFKVFSSINILCLILEITIALLVRLGILNTFKPHYSSPYTYFRDKDRIQRFLHKAPFFLKAMEKQC